MKKMMKWAVAPALALAVSAILADPAIASTVANSSAADGSVLTLTGTGTTEDTSPVLTITFDKTLSAAELARAESEVASATGLEGRSAAAAPNSTVAGPSGASLYCGQAYTFSDTYGSYSFQHACGGTTGPWGYKNSTALCAIVTSTMHEAGMAWTRNGVTQGTQASHTEACGYQFHGTYNPDEDFDAITYNDEITFTVEVDGDPGSAVLDIKGSFTSEGCTSGKECGQAVGQL